MLARLGAIPSVVRYVGSGEIWSREKSQQVHDRQVEHWRRHGFGWRAAVEKASGSQLGLIALNFLGDGTAGLDPGEYEIGWWLQPSDHGRGFAREGAQRSATKPATGSARRAWWRASSRRMDPRSPSPPRSA